MSTDQKTPVSRSKPLHICGLRANYVVFAWVAVFVAGTAWLCSQGFGFGDRFVEFVAENHTDAPVIVLGQTGSGDLFSQQIGDPWEDFKSKKEPIPVDSEEYLGFSIYPGTEDDEVFTVIAVIQDSTVVYRRVFTISELTPEDRSIPVRVQITDMRQ